MLATHSAAAARNSSTGVSLCDGKRRISRIRRRQHRRVITTSVEYARIVFSPMRPVRCASDVGTSSTTITTMSSQSGPTINDLGIA